MSEQLEQVVEVGEYGWEWALTACFYDPTYKAFRVASDSGCSCYYPWESHYALDDYGPPLSLNEAVQEMRSDCYGTVEEREKAILQIREFALYNEVRN